MSDEGQDQITRRSLLNVVLSGSLVSFAVSVVYPIWRYIGPPHIVESTVSSTVAARVGELALNSGKIFRFGSRPAILIHTTSGEWRAFSAVCTHLQCTVQFRPDQERIWCACHNGYFDLTGKNVAGPPPRPLDQLEVTVKEEDVIVSLRS